LNINGHWTELIIDDMIPCYLDGANKNKPKIAFSTSSYLDLWVILIEKAYAKAFGSFANIFLGYAEEAIYDLTGAPYQIYFNQELDDLDE
jgi:calpain-15